MADDDDQIKDEAAKTETLTPEEPSKAGVPVSDAAGDSKADEKARALTQRVRNKISRLAANKPKRYMN